MVALMGILKDAEILRSSLSVSLVMVMDYKHICKVSALMHVTRYQHFSANREVLV